MVGLAATLLATYFYWETPKRYLSVFLMLFLVTGGFQIVPHELMLLPAAGISKTYDWVLVWLMLLFLINPKVFLNGKVWRDSNGFVLFGVVLVVLLFYNLFKVGTEPGVAIRVFRNYLFFLVFLPLVQLRQEDFMKVFLLLIYATTFASLLYCLQPFIGRGILSGAPSEISADGGGLMRFYNLPFYIVPVLLALSIRKYFTDLRFYYLLISVNILAIILTQHRNMVLSILCCYLLYIFMNKKQKVKTLFIYGFISAALFYGIDHFFDDRLSHGIAELTQLSEEVTPALLHSTNISDISTSEFRRLHFLERFYYANKDIWTSLFGVGFLTEDAAFVRQLSFNIGLLTEDGEVIQVDTADIVWSVLIIHFGLVGIAAFLYFYYHRVKEFYKAKEELLCTVGIMYTTALFINSFFGADIISPHAISFLMLITAYAYSIVNHTAPANIPVNKFALIGYKNM